MNSDYRQILEKLKRLLEDEERRWQEQLRYQSIQRVSHFKFKTLLESLIYLICNNRLINRIPKIKNDDSMLQNFTKEKSKMDISYNFKDFEYIFNGKVMEDQTQIELKGLDVALDLTTITLKYNNKTNPKETNVEMNGIGPKRLFVLEFFFEKPSRLVNASSIPFTGDPDDILTSENLRTIVKEWRKRLGDTQKPYRFIQTRHSLGYKLNEKKNYLLIRAKKS